MPAKEGNKYAYVGTSNWAEANSQIDFSELGFCDDDSFYYVFAYVTKFNGIAKLRDDSWSFEPQLIQFKVAKKDYEKTDKEGKQQKVVQSRLEKWLCKLFDELDEGIYSGSLSLQDCSMVESFVTGLDNSGKPVDPTTLKIMQGTYASLELVEKPEKVLPEDIKTPSGKSYSKGGYAKGQTELEKLNDRVSFICQQVNNQTSIPVENFAQLVDILEISPEKETISKILSLCTSLMS
ncbi:MAG: hypothetical protein KME40_32080 [Komarekiella atlantica HA4396-MV6]|nr:hypothetical protein [Komarekiella atlantica HA4396-MV6]